MSLILSTVPIFSLFFMDSTSLNSFLNNVPLSHKINGAVALAIF